MPKDARLSQPEIDKVIKHLQTTWTKEECPFHGPTEWEVDQLVGQVLPYHGGSLVVGGPVFPLVVVTCSKCGFTVLVNAIKAGVVEPERKPPAFAPNIPLPTTTGSSGDA